MHLNPEVDHIIQSEFIQEGFEYRTDINGRLLIAEYRMDKSAGIGMLYLHPKEEVPKGKLNSLIIDVPYLYNLFYQDRMALILEMSTQALCGEIIDYYSFPAYLNSLKRSKNS